MRSRLHLSPRTPPTCIAILRQPASYAPPAAYVDQNIWQGFYAGLNGGYGWSNNGDTILYSDGTMSSRAQPQGGFGGGQIGYNFQNGPLVYGLETDFQGGYLGATSSDLSSKESVDWFGTVRGRVGYAFGHALIYGTGGFAYGDVRQRAIDNGSVLGSSGTQTGWVAAAASNTRSTRPGPLRPNISTWISAARRSRMRRIPPAQTASTPASKPFGSA